MDDGEHDDQGPMTKYVNLSFKKIATMACVIVVLIVIVSLTTTAWERRLGTLSIAAVKWKLTDTWLATQYRSEFNQYFRMLGLASVAPRSTDGTQTTRTQSIPVLVYHGIVEHPVATEDVSVDSFKKHMFALKAAGWQTTTIHDLLRATRGELPLPPKSFLLTFDDGRKDSYYPVDPILQALDYHAVMYVITGHSFISGNAEKKYYLSRSELDQMQASGRWDLQSHSDIGHAFYPMDSRGNIGSFFGNRLWIPNRKPGEDNQAYEARVHAYLENYFQNHSSGILSSEGRLEEAGEFAARVFGDLLDAKTTLEKNAGGEEIISFAYPFGEFRQSQAVQSNYPEGRAILVSAVTQIYPLSFFQWSRGDGFSQNYLGREGSLMRRIEPLNAWTESELRDLLASGQAKQLPYTLRGANDGWRNVWGSVQYVNGGGLEIRANPTTSGATTILDGSRLWGDYAYTATLDWLNAGSVSLIGHYQSNAQNPKNIPSVACTFVEGSIQIRERQGGNTFVLLEEKNPSIGPGENIRVGIVFSGNNVMCTWETQVVASATVRSHSMYDGGVGVEIWSPMLGEAKVRLTNISVTPRK